MLIFHRNKKYIPYIQRKTAKQRLKELLTKFDNIQKVLQKFSTKKIIPDFQRLTHYTRNSLINRTSNHVENYSRQTEPE